MDRKRKQAGAVLMSVICVFTASCSVNAPEMPYAGSSEILVLYGNACKSADPDEDLLSDANIFIVNDRGIVEERIYRKSWQLEKVPGGYGFRADLLRNTPYSIYVLANAGFPLMLSSEDDILGYRYYFAYPDEYREGIPMSGMAKDVVFRDGETIRIPLERTMSKISVCIDRSRLRHDIEFYVNSIRIGKCPKYVVPFGESQVKSESDVFPSGFFKSEEEAFPLNLDTGNGLSGEVSVYMFENICAAGMESYIEIHAGYMSDTHFTMPGKELVYRFYPGEGRSGTEVRRNTHYRITVIPENDGLSESGWRVDKSGIGTYVERIYLSSASLKMSYKGECVRVEADAVPENASFRHLEWSSSDPSVASVDETGQVMANGEGSCTVTCKASDGSGVYAECTVSCRFEPYYLKIYPGNFIRGKTGDRVHIRCEYFPPSALFEIGSEELEYDRKRGIYDYVLDSDGKGVELLLRKKGSGLLYIEAGYPINSSEVVAVVVD